MGTMPAGLERQGNDLQTGPPSQADDRFWWPLDAVSKLLFYTSGVMLIAMMLTIVYGVIMRYVFSSPSIWVMDVSTVLFLLVMVCSFAYTQRLQGHISVELLVMKLNGRMRALVGGIGYLAGLGYLVALESELIRMAARTYRTGETTFGIVSIPMYPLYGIIAFSIFLFALQVLRVSHRQICRAIAGTSEQSAND